MVEFFKNTQSLPLFVTGTTLQSLRVLDMFFCAGLLFSVFHFVFASVPCL